MPWAKDEVWVVDIMVDIWVHRGANVVQVDVIMVGPWMLWGTDDVWVDVIMVWAHGCSGGRMTPGPRGAQGNR